MTDPKKPDQNVSEDDWAAAMSEQESSGSTDDPWAPPRSRDAFAEGYSGAPQTIRDITPPAGNPPIGHMGYFRSDCQPVWDEALDWLLAHPAPPTSTGG